MTKTTLIEKLKNYTYYVTRLREIRERKDNLVYKTTATYGNLAPSVGGFDSKVEKHSLKGYELSKAERDIKAKLDDIVRLIQHSGLTDREKAVMWWIARNGKLQAYARRERIGKDNVYKIRDRAVNKILTAQKHKT